MQRSSPAFLFSALLAIAPASAQWLDGELIVDTVVAGTTALIRVDPATGNSQVLVSGHNRVGWAGAVVFDNYRNALIANVSLPPDPYYFGKLYAISSNGSATAIPGLTNLTVRGLCTAGDGRLFYQVHNTGEIRWIDATNTVHTLQNAAGTAPFQFTVEHMLYHAPTNSLLATNSGWWSTNHCGGTVGCSIHRIPLSGDGSRVAGAPTCAQFASNDHEVMSLDYMPGGDVLLCLANGSYSSYPKLLRVVPSTLAVTVYANSSIGDLNGGYYCAATGKVVVLDDASNVLREYGAGSSGLGSVLATNLPVSTNTSGYSPAESIWRVDRNGPGCQGTAIAYGAGLAGTGGFVPTLGVVGCPDLGASFSLSADLLVGGTIGLLVLGAGPANVPAFGGSILIFPIVTTVVVVGNGAPNIGGVGSAGIGLTITDPALLGVSFWLQGAFADAGAVEGLSLTNGLQVVIG